MFQCTVRETRAEGKTVYYAVATRTELAVYGGLPGAPRALRVWRRYSDFEALHEQLCLVKGAGRLPPLPAKNVFAAFGGDKIMEERRSAFESLMSYVGGDELLRQHPLVAEFVGASPYPAAPPAAASPAPASSAPAASPAAKPARPASPPPPAVVEKPTWKAHPFEDALSALAVSDSPKKADAAPRAAAQPQPAAAAKPKPAAAAPSKPSSFQPFSFGSVQPAAANTVYEKSGEGLRDAIKAGDVAGANGLLAAGVDPNYVDAQGMSLLHVAALFNAGDIALALLSAGANAAARNAQGETPLEVAPVALAHRLKARAEELAKAKAAA